LAILRLLNPQNTRRQGRRPVSNDLEEIVSERFS